MLDIICGKDNGVMALFCNADGSIDKKTLPGKMWPTAGRDCESGQDLICRNPYSMWWGFALVLISSPAS